LECAQSTEECVLNTMVLFWRVGRGCLKRCHVIGQFGVWKSAILGRLERTAEARIISLADWICVSVRLPFGT